MFRTKLPHAHFFSRENLQLLKRRIFVAGQIMLTTVPFLLTRPPSINDGVAGKSTLFEEIIFSPTNSSLLREKIIRPNFAVQTRFWEGEQRKFFLPLPLSRQSWIRSGARNIASRLTAPPDLSPWNFNLISSLASLISSPPISPPRIISRISNFNPDVTFRTECPRISARDKSSISLECSNRGFNCRGLFSAPDWCSPRFQL